MRSRIQMLGATLVVASACHDGPLTDAFPSEQLLIETLEKEGGMSRIYGGIHYRFDVEVGHAIGRAAARLALERRGLE